MAEYGILMRDEMVRALLRPPDDPLRKTVTRRTSDQWADRKVGDLLWVKECWAPADAAMPRVRVCYRSDGVSYGLNGGWATASPSGGEGGLVFPEPLGIRAPFPARWRPSILMPRWASRFTLRIVDLRREEGAGFDGDGAVWPLPAVNDAEARREGVEDRTAYLSLWESINGPVYPERLWRIELEEVARG